MLQEKDKKNPIKPSYVELLASLTQVALLQCRVSNFSFLKPNHEFFQHEKVCSEN